MPSPDITVPFSTDLLDVFRRYQNGTQETRQKLTQELASIYFKEYDETDSNLNEDMHTCMAEYLLARLTYESKAAKVARYVSDQITASLEGSPLEVLTQKAWDVSASN